MTSVSKHDIISFYMVKGKKGIHGAFEVWKQTFFRYENEGLTVSISGDFIFNSILVFSIYTGINFDKEKSFKRIPGLHQMLYCLVKDYFF